MKNKGKTYEAVWAIVITITLFVALKETWIVVLVPLLFAGRFVSILKTARSGLAEDEHGYNMWAKGVLLASIASVITYIILTMITTFPLNIVFAVLLGRLLYSTWKYWKTASTLEKAQKIKTLNEDKSEKEKVIIQ